MLIYASLCIQSGEHVCGELRGNFGGDGWAYHSNHTRHVPPWISGEGRDKIADRCHVPIIALGTVGCSLFSSAHQDPRRGVHGGVRPFHQKSSCLTQLTVGPRVVQTWSRSTPASGVNETRVPPRALRGGISKSIFQRRCQYLAINAHEMAPRTGRWLQERGRDAPT